MSCIDFLDEIRKRKACLRSQKTIVTCTSGKKYIEHLTASGEANVRLLDDESWGFVVDNTPDLQVAEILPHLFLSSQDVVQDRELLKRNNITHVLSIGVDVPSTACMPFAKYKKIDLLDEPNSDLFSVLDASFDFIDSAVKENKCNKVLVHCNAGYSRSPSIVIAYLMRSLGLSFENALDAVRKKREVRPNVGFMNQLKQFESNLKQHSCLRN